MPELRRILHPTDFSPASRPALARAVALAKASRGRLTVLHVVSRAVPYVRELHLREQLRAAIRDEAQRRLDALLSKAKEARVSAEGVLVEGEPHREIVRVATSRHADVIVMGTHGRTGLSRFLMGSVATRVLREAPCPVLTVRRR
jgi:universal stress protein A